MTRIRDYRVKKPLTAIFLSEFVEGLVSFAKLFDACFVRRPISVKELDPMMTCDPVVLWWGIIQRALNRCIFQIYLSSSPVFHGQRFKFASPWIVPGRLIFQFVYLTDTSLTSKRKNLDSHLREKFYHQNQVADFIFSQVLRDGVQDLSRRSRVFPGLGLPTLKAR